MPDEPVQIITQVAYYGRVPESLLLDVDASDAECRLYAVLTRYDWRQSHEVWPTWEELSKRLGWSRAKLARVLGLLVERGAVETRRKGRRPNLIVLRADTFEVSDLTPQESLGSQIQGSGVSNPENAPLTNERKNESARAAGAYESEFDDWYADYPRHVDRKPAFAAYKARRRQGVTPDQLIHARDNYARSVDGTGQEFVKYPATFLAKDGPWSEWLYGPPAGAKPTPKPEKPETPTRVVDGRTQRFMVGTGWMDTGA